jgi:hypothetical protein
MFRIALSSPGTMLGPAEELLGGRRSLLRPPVIMPAARAAYHGNFGPRGRTKVLAQARAIFMITVGFLPPTVQNPP